MVQKFSEMIEMVKRCGFKLSKDSLEQFTHFNRNEAAHKALKVSERGDNFFEDKQNNPLLKRVGVYPSNDL